MNAWVPLSLALLLPAIGASAVDKTVAPPDKRIVTVHRCTDAKGQITFQDDPCPKGSQDKKLEMERPADPPAQARAKPSPPPMVYYGPAPEDYPQQEITPPPPMYHCTSYDGIERFSESYDPNPRCEPFVLYYPYPNNLSPSQALTCRWVEDSCVRMSDQAACDRWRAMKKEAASAVLHSFSDTAEYRKSELARLTQIVNESCS